MTIECLRLPLERSGLSYGPIVAEDGPALLLGEAGQLVCATLGDRTYAAISHGLAKRNLSSRTTTIARNLDQPDPHAVSRELSTPHAPPSKKVSRSKKGAADSSCGERMMEQLPFELTLLSAGDSSERRFPLALSEVHMAFLIVQHHGSPAELWKYGKRVCRISLSSNGVWHLSACK